MIDARLTGVMLGLDGRLLERGSGLELRRVDVDEFIGSTVVCMEKLRLKLALKSSWESRVSLCK